MSIYTDAQKIASDLLAAFKQGVIEYVRMVPQPGTRPDAPLPPIPQPVAINATARPVSTKYVDGSHIVRSDKQVTIPNDGKARPEMSGSVRIDGVTHKIIEIMPRPAAGEPVVWVVVVRK